MPDARQHTLLISSPPDSVDVVHSLLETVWSDVPAIPAMERVRFETALIELASNVIRHADSGAGVSCVLVVSTFAERIEAVLRDTGEPGAVHLLDREMPGESAESGRGIPLIQALVDELVYDRESGFNVWKISRRFE